MKRLWTGALVASFALSMPMAYADDAEPPPPAAPSDTAVPSLPDLSGEQIAERVQKFYDGAKTFQAQFSQRYTIFAYNKKKESQGHVAFAKPGKMSWRYTSNGNRVVSDGRLLKVYEAENKQLYEQEVTKSAYPAALSFLIGEGKLEASFTLKKLNADSVGFKGGYVLLAIPREPTPAYQKMLLYVDGKTFQVRRVLLIDAQKNKNVFDFSEPLVNVAVPPSEFQFATPPGTQIIKP
jgi:outer membrane lipoprotein carrier protein